MICKKCGTEVKEGTKFCAECGTPVVQQVVEEPVVQEEEKVCSNCGAQLKEGKKFCSECGAPVTQQKIEESTVEEPEVQETTEEPVVQEKEKVCSNCGAQLQEGKKFCSECGTKIDSEVSTKSKKSTSNAESKEFDEELARAFISKKALGLKKTETLIQQEIDIFREFANEEKAGKMQHEHFDFNCYSLGPIWLLSRGVKKIRTLLLYILGCILVAFGVMTGAFQVAIPGIGMILFIGSNCGKKGYGLYFSRYKEVLKKAKNDFPNNRKAQIDYLQHNK